MICQHCVGNDGADGKDGINGQDGKDGIDGVDGRDGIDGNTPFIGDNGNWWIAGSDTGVKAQGADGADGQNGENGKDGICSGYFLLTAVSRATVFFKITQSHHILRRS